MPIQFRCVRCNEPLEVDDDLAEKMVRCPYCEAVVSVPASSTLDVGGVATARGAVGQPPPPPVGANLPPSPTLRAAAPQTAPLGTAALGCTGMVILCFIATVAYSLLTGAALGPATSQPVTLEGLREQVQQQVETGSYDRFSTAMSCGLFFFMLAGLGFGIAALVRREPGAWRGWTAVAVCGLGMACQVLAAIALAVLMR